MSTEDATRLAGLLGTLVTLVIGVLTARNAATKARQESTEQRMARESAERQDDFERIDKQTQYLITQMQATVERMAARVERLEQELENERKLRVEAMGDLATAKIEIRRLTADNGQLKRRIAELEKHEDRGNC